MKKLFFVMIVGMQLVYASGKKTDPSKLFNAQNDKQECFDRTSDLREKEEERKLKLDAESKRTVEKVIKIMKGNS